MHSTNSKRPCLVFFLLCFAKRHGALKSWQRLASETSSGTWKTTWTRCSGSSTSPSQGKVEALFFSVTWKALLIWRSRVLSFRKSNLLIQSEGILITIDINTNIKCLLGDKKARLLLLLSLECAQCPSLHHRWEVFILHYCDLADLQESVLEYVYVYWKKYPCYFCV